MLKAISPFKLYKRNNIILFVRELRHYYDVILQGQSVFPLKAAQWF